jgi:anaerobic magnesium-protoporphyrin IX monomethyl ester cyclase
MTQENRPKKVLFVTVPYHYGLSDVMGRWIPLNLVYLAGAARQAGLEAEIYDAQAKDHGYPEIGQRIADSRADYVACSAITATVNDALKTLELAKETLPGAVTLLGGVHPSFMYREVLESAAVDYVIIGEGEDTLRELLQVLEAGGDPGSVAGIAYRREGELVCTPRRPLIGDLDALPAAWDLLDWDDYRYQVMPGSRLGSISTSRGCDHDCTFCSQAPFWGKSWRGRDPRQVADELAHLHANYGVTVFQITDEYPTRDPQRWETLLDLLIERQLPISLMMETRTPDLIRDRDLIGKYRRAGIIHVSIGVEGRDQESLDAMRKGMDAGQAREALELLRAHGIVSEISFVLGFPDETAQGLVRTLKLAQELNPDSCNFLALTPWPYTDLFRELEPHLRVRDYSRYNMIDPVLEPTEMTLLQVEIALTDCFRKFYMGKIMEIMTMKDEFRRGYMVRASKLIMGSSFVLKKFGMLMLGRVPAKIGELKQSISGSRPGGGKESR